MKKLLLVLSVVAMASFLFVGCLGVTPEVNNAPEIASAAITSATVGEAYTCDVDATDPDEGDVLTYSLVAKPADMAIDAATGEISWTPAAAGTFPVIVSVSDGELSDTQSFSITVVEAEVEPEPENNAPEITSTAVTSVTLPAAYTYAVVAIDEDGDTLTYDLIPKYGFAPVGMTISIAGVINWTPTVADVGVHSVTVEVSDGELTDTQSFTVTVSPVPVGPTVVSLLPLEATVGELYAGEVTADVGDDATLTCTLVGAPAGMTITAAGLITWTPDTAGNQVVTVVVTDGAGLSDTKDFTIVVAARVGPVITAIPDGSIPYGVEWTYDVDVTPGTSPESTFEFELTVAPYTMVIDPSTGLITWTPIAIQEGFHPVIVKVTAADGLYDEETFLLLVVEPVVIPLTATIEYGADHSYTNGKTYVRGYDVWADCVPVEVTFNEAVEHDVQIRWHDIDGDVGDWEDLDDSGDGITFEGCLPFDGEWGDCEVVCVEWRLFDEELVCCPEYFTDPVSFGAVYVDFEAPCASFVVTVEDCEDPCEPFLSISWTSECVGPCDSYDCCCDECSGVNGWEFILDASDDPICNPGECDLVTGNDCVIEGQFGCALDCLIWADTGEVVYTIDYSISDNVGNEYTDVWIITVDIDSVTDFTTFNGHALITQTGAEEYTLDYDCSCIECGDCYPLEVVED